MQIELKTPDQIAVMRQAGQLLADVLAQLEAAVAPGVTTKELDELANRLIRDAGATPSFYGYQGFPASICASVNEEVVHGIPGQRVLAAGDSISIDCGVIVDGWHSDSAITVHVGGEDAVDSAVRAMTTACYDAMWAGIAQIRPGNRLTDISHAIEVAIKAAGSYGIVRGWGGHGIGSEMHQDPHILNHGKPGKGPVLREGMALAIEPMITLGKPGVSELADGWTIVTEDGSRAAHTEHSVAVMADGPWVLSAVDGGASCLGDVVSVFATES